MMHVPARLPFRVPRGAGRCILGILLALLAAGAAQAGAREKPAEPRQVFRPMPLDVVDVVWRADAREPGLRFRLYREDQSGRLRILADIPALLGEHDYRLKDLPLDSRQRYVLRLLDGRGRENPLETIELVGYRTVDPNTPRTLLVASGEVTLPSHGAGLPPPPSATVFPKLRDDDEVANRSAEPPDPPPERLGVRYA